MRFVTFKSAGDQRPGLVVGETTIVDLTEAFSIARQRGSIDADVAVPGRLVDVIAGGDRHMRACETIFQETVAGTLAEASVAIAGVSLLAPIPRPQKNVFCVGSNYRAHVTEANRAQAKQDKVPDFPVFFTKPPTSVVGPGDAVRLDTGVSDKMDYEVELGVVIGTAGRNISAADAYRHIFGVTIINDITARDIQRRHGGQFLKGKGLDTACPMGPQIVTLNELPNIENLRISLTVNGEARQDGNTGNMIFPIARLLESLSEGMTLEPGDILATGTPSGVGYAMDPPNYLRNGDVITCEIEGIGQLQNVVRDVSAATFAA